MPASTATCYFGYGSNLWKEQMSLRCPSSIYLGVGRLPYFQWMINKRGYANIVQSNNYSDIVYGLVYSLTISDENALDGNEGVPWAYTKETMTVELWASKDGSTVDVAQGGEKKDMLVYIDRKRTDNNQPKEEYIHRMNMGIRDCVTMGIPNTYVEKVMRPFIPEQVRKEVEDLAKRQALSFEDEK